jgi:hypothetical protein
MDLENALGKIRGLIAKADSLEQSGDEHSIREALACRERADAMMQRYAVQEWQTIQAAPVKAKPKRIKINIGEADNPFLTEMATLVNIVAKFCKCSSVWMTGSAYAPTGKQEYCWVYGYESDLRYFEMLFTTLFLHMGGAIFPKPDPNKTLGQNAYELHNAGLNWFDIAKAYGWYKVESRPGEAQNMYVNQNTSERLSWSKSIGSIKKAYAVEVARRHEEPLRIPPSGSYTFRLNAAQGYLSRIGQRLREISGQRGSGAELVLADKSQNITAMLAEDFPAMKNASARKNTYNAAAYAKGTQHANSASLNPEAGGSTRAALS